MKKPKVSIIIPVYNGSLYLKDAIDSAINQTYENLEIIVVNDGSKDNHKTRNIALSYGDKIRYFEKENGGVSTALNLGIEKMEGDYFSWLSHDDLYYPNKISREVELLEKYDDSVILYSDYELIDAKGTHLSYVYGDHKLLSSKPEYAILRGMIGGITLLIPKTAFFNVGLFSQEHRCVQDYELWFKFSFKYKFVHIPEVLAITRIHSKQDSNTSPLVLSEGNWLWKMMAEKFPLKKKEEYEGSEYLFYLEMSSYLRNTPYLEAAEYLSSKAKNILDNHRFMADDKSITVIVDLANQASYSKVISAIRRQDVKNMHIIVKSAFNESDFKPSSISGVSFTQASYSTILEKINSDFIVFVNDLFDCNNCNWLNEQMVNLCLSNKGLAFSDFVGFSRDGFADKYDVLLTLSIYGVIINFRKVKKSGIVYKDEVDFLYSVIHKLGSTYSDKKYFSSCWNYVEDFLRIKKLLSFLIVDNDVDDYTLSTVSYFLSTVYNNSGHGRKIAMNYPCNQYLELLNSRSFHWYLKFIEWKKKRKMGK